MPKKTGKKSAGSLRKTATAAVAAGKVGGRGVRYTKEDVLNHVNHFRELQLQDPSYTQTKYAAEHGVSAGTFSRWLFENKDSEAVERPIRGLLPAAPSDVPAVAVVEAAPAVANGNGAAKKPVKKTPTEELEDLRIAFARVESEKDLLLEELATVNQRNGELKIAIRNISGSL